VVALVATGLYLLAKARKAESEGRSLANEFPLLSEILGLVESNEQTSQQLLRLASESGSKLDRLDGKVQQLLEHTETGQRTIVSLLEKQIISMMTKDGEFKAQISAEIETLKTRMLVNTGVNLASKVLRLFGV